MLTISLLTPTAAAFGQDAGSVVDKSQLDSGIVTINYTPQKEVPVKIMIKKDDTKYTYDFKQVNTFPLQLGNGEYEISVLENLFENKYKVTARETVTLELADSKQVFLQSIQLICWNDGMDSIKKARELAAKAANDEEKVAAIYDYIVSSITYDYDKVSSIGPDYVPSIEAVMDDSMGICYDYSSLFAAMLRSLGIPAKLIMGYKNDIRQYHAWNQVYLKDSSQWVTIDTCYDSIMKQANAKVSMVKDSSQYIEHKQY